MICPICGCATTVIQTWENSKGEYKRRRECLDCGHRYTTVEAPIDKPNEEMNLNEDREPAMLECPSKPKKAQPWGMSDLCIALRSRPEVAINAGHAIAPEAGQVTG